MTMTQRGFTIIELLVVIIITSALSIITVTMGIDYMKQAANLTAKSNFFIERLNTSDYLRQNIGMSTGLVNQNTIADVNTLVPDPSDATNQHWKMLHAIPGRFGEASSTTPILYYTQNAYRTDNTPLLNGDLPYQNEFIIYHHGPSGELRVRSLAAPGAGVDNRTKTTCTTETAGCTRDRVLITGVEYVEIRYFSRSGAKLDLRGSCSPSLYGCGTTTYCDPLFPTTGNDSICNGPPTCEQAAPYTGCNGLDLGQVEVVQFKVRVKKTVESDKNHPIYNSTIIRIALRNA